MKGQKGYYAIYKNDVFVDMGTLDELAERLNVKKRTLMFYNSPAYRRRAEKVKNHHQKNGYKTIYRIGYEGDEIDDEMC